jgi:procollagen-lysine,2-oxoglutarate 5-dioxygenase 2
MDKFYYITIATKPHPVLENIKKKVAENNETLTVLGGHENRLIGWEGTGNFGIKLREVSDFLKNDYLQPNDIVLFSDAYDVAYCGNKADIIERYLAMKAPIVFGSETCCNPSPALKTHYLIRNFEFSYLNSGLFIGRVWALRKCILDYKYNDNDDDQLYWTRQYLKHIDLIKLDYENSLFLNTFDMDMSKFKWDGKTALYKGRNPLFVHINGPEKSMINIFL